MPGRHPRRPPGLTLWGNDMKRKTIELPKAFLAERDRRFSGVAMYTRGISLAASGGAVEITLYNEIGFWGVNARTFKSALDSARGKDIRLRINSPGGDVFDGVAMYNDLLLHDGNVDVLVTGVAASVASIVAMAGRTIEIAPAASMMIHRAWGAVVGNANDMADFAKVLVQIDAAMAGVYASRSGKTAEEMLALMDAETWFFGQGAVDAGLADKVTAVPDDTANAAARLDFLRGSRSDDARLNAALVGLYDTMTR